MLLYQTNVGKMQLSNVQIIQGPRGHKPLTSSVFIQNIEYQL